MAKNNGLGQFGFPANHPEQQISIRQVFGVTTNATAAHLTPVVVFGQSLALAVSVILAGVLAPAAFEAYVTAAAIFSLLVSLAPLGVEKLALRVLPPAFDAKNGALLRAYLRFALLRSAMGVGGAGLVALVWAFGLADMTPAAKTAILVGCLALPFGAAVQLGQEVLTAAGQAQVAMWAARVTAPLTAIVLIAAAVVVPGDLSGATAIACWTVGWVLASIWIAARLRAVMRRVPGAADPVPAAAQWRAAAWPLWLYRLAVGLRGQAGLIGLVWLDAPAEAVGGYATAQAIVGLLVVPVMATNRIFASDIARILHRGNTGAFVRLRAQRLAWLMPVLLVLVGLALLLPQQILSLVQPAFAETGAGALRVLSAAAAVSMVLALAPTYLKFRGQNRAVFSILVGAVAVQIGLLIGLVPGMAATGAALAYAIPTTVSYVVFAVLGRRSTPPRPDDLQR